MNKPQFANNKLMLPANRNGGNWSLIYQPDLFHSGEVVTLFDNNAGEDWIIIPEDEYANRRAQVLEHEGQEAASAWEFNTRYCTPSFVNTCLGVPYEDELNHMKAVWQALNLLANIG